MKSIEEGLLEAVDRFNQAQLAEFRLRTGLRYLGYSGPVFLSGTVRVRGLFVDPAGTHWTDADLIVESAYLRSPWWDHYHDRLGGNLEPAHELRVMSPERGWVDALIGPVAEICELVDLPAPESFPDGWARSWRTFPWLEDAQALEMVAVGLPADPDFLGGRRR